MKNKLILCLVASFYGSLSYAPVGEPRSPKSAVAQTPASRSSSYDNLVVLHGCMEIYVEALTNNKPNQKSDSVAKAADAKKNNDSKSS